MSRRSLAGALALVALLLLTLGTAAVALLRYEPRHHRAADVPPSAGRTLASNKCLEEFIELYNVVQEKEEDKWSREFSFTDEQINSFLSEGLVQRGLADQVLPEGVSEPRVTFEQGVMRLSFRYQTKLLNTVVSVALRPWVVRGEGNAVVVSVEGLYAGAVPFDAQWLFERLTDSARQHDIDITWYNHKGNRTAHVRFQANQARPTIKLRSIAIEDGRLTVHSEPTDRARTAMHAAAEGAPAVP